MSIDLALSQLVAALDRNTAALQASQGTAVGQQSPQQMAAANLFPGQQAASVQPMGMPGMPFPGQQAAPVQPAGPVLQKSPYADAAALQAWAYTKYQANTSLMPAMEAIIKGHGLVQLDNARADQLDSLYTAFAAL